MLVRPQIQLAGNEFAALVDADKRGSTIGA